MVTLNQSHEHQVLWLVYGTKPNLHISSVAFNTFRGHSKTALWGFSIWKRQAGFRTIGCSLEYLLSGSPLREGCETAEVFDDRELAIEYYLANGNSTDSVVDIRAREAVTPPLKFLKKRLYHHTMVVDV